MAKARLKVDLSGFDEMLDKIKAAGGNVDSSCEKLINTAANTLQTEMKNQMNSSGVESAFVNRMPPPMIEKDGNSYSVVAGYDKGAYDPNNLSDGYKAVFLNYGTPKRKKHGKMEAIGFIQKTKKAAKKPIRKEQEKALHEILRGLEE